MIDNLLLQVVEEISQAGPEGILLGALWATLGIQDVYLKRYLWLKLFEIPNISLHFIGELEGQIVDPESYEETIVKVVAAPVLFKPALGIYDPSISLTQAQVKLMRHIAVYKENGVLQSDLSKFVQADARTVFYNLRQPIDCGLIARKSVPDRNTNILCLSKYSRFGTSAGFFPMRLMEDDPSLMGREPEEENRMQLDTLCRAVCSLIMNSPNQEMSEDSIKRALKLQPMLWMTLKRHLTRQGFLGLTRVREDLNPLLVSGVRLLRPYEEEVPPTLVVELPLLYQLYGSIASSGLKGIRQSDLVRLCFNPPRHVSSAIQQLTAHFGIIAVRENLGRLTTFRLFCREFLLQDASMALLMREEEGESGGTGGGGGEAAERAGGVGRATVGGLGDGDIMRAEEQYLRDGLIGQMIIDDEGDMMMRDQAILRGRADVDGMGDEEEEEDGRRIDGNEEGRVNRTGERSGRNNGVEAMNGGKIIEDGPHNLQYDSGTISQHSKIEQKRS
ncbi:uncharacterized protein MONOS_13096 [Monocercomonoides exilis]|uniref:uncharacterized protein n=1 Tax=Monocercomonoides exilis TaxID=2049356 RepID=UPI003559F527|nr:hypothetical protein MONOS_13096 [Monocercomonoides exilis]|eukprot:MONOS_13096.1-p1 / transcript=MONOS_13096.1 / gene=MONOS_13096 / organism=Monocercomonoides_exilis_PA203 / gene_product=unspecified product / transcript_product=unspecified product / location=Mono_scaffold00777:23600-25108(+) / protein_length=502 / sequence_SO=supercontig / SO=protein_coding / is_pseudo=false